MQTLQTLVHISDLHFGKMERESLAARTEFWKRLPILDGLLGHSADSISNFDSFFHRFRQDHQAHLIMTGDATATGHEEEFQIANQYLGDVLYGPVGEAVGVEVPDWGRRAVPGNHDQWGGSPWSLGGSPVDLVKYFSKLPQTGPTLSLDRGLQLRLLRVDTDADCRLIDRVPAGRRPASIASGHSRRHTTMFPP